MTPAARVLLLVYMILVGCSSSKKGSETPDAVLLESSPRAAAWGSYDMYSSKNQPVRPPQDSPFYYKECVETGDGSFYSKTSYWCSEL